MVIFYILSQNADAQANIRVIYYYSNFQFDPI